MRRELVAVLFVLTALGNVAACGSQTTSNAGSDGLTVASGEALQATFDEWATVAEGGGTAHVRDVGGRVFTLATGEDPSSGDPLSADDRVRVGSVSKMFTAALVLQLVDDGLVDLDQPAGFYVEGLPAGADVTVRHVLGHRSGIPNYTDTEGFGRVVVDGPDRSPTPTDLLEFVAGDNSFDAGTSFEYSNSNYIVAGMLIEAVDGQTLAESLAQRITEPLELERTEFDDGTLGDVAAGYTGLIPGGTSAARSYRSMALGAWAAGGLVSTPSDVGTFLDALLFGDLISTESREAMLAGLETGGEYGLGIHAGADFGVGHGGSIVGFNSMAEVDLTTREMVVVVVNNDLRDPDVASAALVEVLRAN